MPPAFLSKHLVTNPCWSMAVRERLALIFSRQSTLDDDVAVGITEKMRNITGHNSSSSASKNSVPGKSW